MKIPKAKIEKAVSKDPKRPHLHNVWLDAKKKVLVATSGEILAAVPVEPDDVDTGWITPASIQDARKVSVAPGGALRRPVPRDVSRIPLSPYRTQALALQRGNPEVPPRRYQHLHREL